MHLAVSPIEAMGMCLFFTILYVGSLYVWYLFQSKEMARDDKDTILKRFASVIAVSIIAPCFFPLFAKPSDLASSNTAAILGGGDGPSLQHILGLRIDNLLESILWPSIHVILLFSGSYYMKFGDFVRVHGYRKGMADPRAATGESTANAKLSLISQPTLLPEFIWYLITDDFSGRDSYQGLLIGLRNYIVGPVTEEWIFRSCMCPLMIAAGFTTTQTILGCPLFFSFAHVHHILRTDSNRPPAGAVAFQMVYTAVFGWYAAYLFLRTGNVASAVIAHTICNIMQVPPFQRVSSHDHPKVCISLFVGGLIFFFSSAPYITDPLSYNGSMYYAM